MTPLPLLNLVLSCRRKEGIIKGTGYQRGDKPVELHDRRQCVTIQVFKTATPQKCMISKHWHVGCIETTTAAEIFPLGSCWSVQKWKKNSQQGLDPFHKSHTVY